MKEVIPAAIESMIEGLTDPNRNRFLKDSHLAMMERSIKAMQQAIDEYKGSQRQSNRR